MKEQLTPQQQKAKELVEKYKSKIADLQRKRDYYDKSGRAGMCITITGAIGAYNAVISDLNRTFGNPLNKK